MVFFPPVHIKCGFDCSAPFAFHKRDDNRKVISELKLVSKIVFPTNISSAK